MSAKNGLVRLRHRVHNTAGHQMDDSSAPLAWYLNQAGILGRFPGSHSSVCNVVPMGSSTEYHCNDCGTEFSAEDGFSCGFSGDVFTTVVCGEHGIGTSDIGVNVREDTSIRFEDRETFPCPICGKQSPRWNTKSCPKCGSEKLKVIGMIEWD